MDHYVDNEHYNVASLVDDGQERYAPLLEGFVVQIQEEGDHVEEDHWEELQHRLVEECQHDEAEEEVSDQVYFYHKTRSALDIWFEFFLEEDPLLKRKFSLVFEHFL